MLLATSQDATSASVSIGGDASFDPNDLLDFTFDTTYSSGVSSTSFFIDLVCGNGQTYVGIAGHNLGTLNCTVTIKNHGANDIFSFAPIDDRPIMFSIPARSGGAKDIVIEITKPSASNIVTIAHIATGTSTDLTSNSFFGQEIKKDYQSGYPRIPMGLNRKIRTTVNNKAAPTATLIKTISSKLRLNINNVPTNFAATSVLVFQRFWVDNAFFIQNDEDTNQSYLAFDFIPSPPKTHGGTRELVNLSYSFLGYNGQ